MMEIPIEVVMHITKLIMWAAILGVTWYELAQIKEILRWILNCLYMEMVKKDG